MKRNNKTWIRQLSESYVRLNEQYDIEKAHDDLRKTGTTSFHYKYAPEFAKHFGFYTQIGTTGNLPQNVGTDFYPLGGIEEVNHPEHGPLTVERDGDMFVISKYKKAESPWGDEPYGV